MGVLKLPVKSEFYFAKPRMYRFDWAIPELKIAIEYEGLNCEKSGHITISGYTENCRKYNLALKLGWKVYRYTFKNYKDVLIDLADIKP